MTTWIMVMAVTILMATVMTTVAQALLWRMIKSLSKTEPLFKARALELCPPVPFCPFPVLLLDKTEMNILTSIRRICGNGRDHAIGVR